MTEERPDQDEATIGQIVARKRWTTPILTVAAIDDVTRGTDANTPYDGGGFYFS